MNRPFRALVLVWLAAGHVTAGPVIRVNAEARREAAERRADASSFPGRGQVPATDWEAPEMQVAVPAFLAWKAPAPVTIVFIANERRVTAAGSTELAPDGPSLTPPEPHPRATV